MKGREYMNNNNMMQDCYIDLIEEVLMSVIRGEMKALQAKAELIVLEDIINPEFIDAKLYLNRAIKELV